MAAVLCRRGAQLCCVHRELYRVVRRPQAVCFSSKPTERKEPRRTHIKKAKPQPPIDIDSLVKKLFSLTRADIAPSKVRATRGALKPPPASSVTPSSAPPVVSSSTFPVKHNDASDASSSNVQPSPQPNTNPETLDRLGQTPPAGQPVTKPETASESWSAESVESINLALEPPSESSLPPDNVPETRTSAVEGPAEPSVHVYNDQAQPEGANSEVLHFSHAKESSAVESPIESRVTAEESPVRIQALEGPVEPDPKIESNNSRLGTVDVLQGTAEELSMKPQLESSVEFSLTLIEPLGGPVESTIDVTIDNTPQEQIKSADTVINTSLAVGVTNLTQTTIESPVESLEELPQAEELSAKSPVECTIDVTIDAHLEVLDKSVDVEGRVAQAAGIEYTIETTIESRGEATLSTIETLEAPALTEESGGTTVESRSVFTHSIHSGVEERPIETKIEQAEGSCGGTVESKIKEDDHIFHMDSSQNAQNLESEAENEPKKMTLESMTLHSVTVALQSLQSHELLRTKSELDEKAALVHTAEDEGPAEGLAESQTDGVDDGETLTQVLATWESLSEDLEGLEGESGVLVSELLCSVPTAVPQTSVELNTSADLPEAARSDSSSGRGVSMTLESITLAEVEGAVEGLETEVLQETSRSLEEEAEELIKEERMQVEAAGDDSEALEDLTEAEALNLFSIEEATDAIEAQTSMVMEAMFGSEQGTQQSTGVLLKEPPPHDDRMSQEVGTARDQGGADVLEAMSVESVTLAEVEASLGALEVTPMSETADDLEKEIQVLIGQERMEVEEEVVNVELLSLPEGEELFDALENDVLMEELLFTVPGQAAAEEEGRPVPESPEIQTDVDPVQRLFLQKLREYRQTSSELILEDPLLIHRLSEETDKLQRVFGGGDLTSFPRFHFPDPQLDQDSK